VSQPFRNKPVGSEKENEHESENCHNYRTDPFTPLVGLLEQPPGLSKSQEIWYKVTTRLLPLELQELLWPFLAQEWLPES